MKNKLQVSEVLKTFLRDVFHFLNENFKGQPISSSKGAVHTQF